MNGSLSVVACKSFRDGWMHSYSFVWNIHIYESVPYWNVRSRHWNVRSRHLCCWNIYKVAFGAVGAQTTNEQDAKQLGGTIHKTTIPPCTTTRSMMGVGEKERVRR